MAECARVVLLSYRSDDEDRPAVPPSVKTITSSADLGTKIDLQRLSDLIDNAEYSSGDALSKRSLKFRIRNPKTTTQVRFHHGLAGSAITCLSHTKLLDWQFLSPVVSLPLKEKWRMLWAFHTE
jgi:hypothetical protein